MPVYKNWYAKSGALYQPNRVVYEFVWLWFALVFLLTQNILRPHLFLWVSISFVLIFAFQFFLKFKRFGWLGEPVIIVAENKITVKLNQSKPIEVDVYSDDEVHVVGPENQRFIRFLSNTHPKRELVLYRSQRLIKYITNRLSKKHRVVIEEFPSFMSQCRRDY